MHSLLLALATTPAPTPTPSLRPGLSQDQVTPGLLGFLLTAFIVVALHYAHPAEPLPRDEFERERQLAELRAIQAGQRSRLP